MRIIIPKPIRKEIERVIKGKKKKKLKKKEYSKEHLLTMAGLNLEFLTALAKTEPVKFLLNKDSFLILGEFSPKFPELLHGHKPQGALWLLKRNDEAGLYYWLDADYPANRSDRDYELITPPHLTKWHDKSLERFALLTKKEIWENIAMFLSYM